jgi:hypothetical protein
LVIGHSFVIRASSFIISRAGCTMPLFALETHHITLIAGIGLFLLVMINRIRRSFNQSTRPGYEASPRGIQRTSSRNLTGQPIGSARLRSASASKEQEDWEVEMHDLARQLKGEIDTKMQALQGLIRAADEGAARLDAAIDRAESLGLLDESSRASAVTSGWVKAQDEPRASKSNNSASHAKTRAARGTIYSGRTNAGQNLADDPRFERVYALADAGFSAAKIAGQIGSQVGEVELILSLRGAS